jgi:hypothetical protein
MASAARVTRSLFHQIRDLELSFRAKRGTPIGKMLRFIWVPHLAQRQREVRNDNFELEAHFSTAKAMPYRERFLRKTIFEIACGRVI